MVVKLENGKTLETYIIEHLKNWYEPDENTWEHILKKATKDFTNDANLEGAFDFLFDEVEIE